MGQGEFLDQSSEGDHAVGGGQRIGIMDVHLDLSGCVFRVRLFNRNADIVQMPPDRTDDMFEFGGPRKTVDLNAGVLRAQSFGIEQIEFQLGADVDLVPLDGCALDDVNKRASRIDRNRFVVHALGAPETERNALFARQRVNRPVWKHVHVGITVVEIGIWRVPNIAGHIEGEQG